MKNWISVYIGHDSNLTIYDVAKDEFVVVQIESIVGEKHVNVLKQTDVFNHRNPDFKPTLTKILNIAGYKNDFHYVDITPFNNPAGSRAGPDGTKIIPDNYKMLEKFWWTERHSFKTVEEKYLYEPSSHHENHAWCAYAQSNMKNAYCFTWDGGGDDTCFAEFTFVDGRITSENYPHYNLNTPYSKICNKFQYFSETDVLDIAGKVMGMSAYSDKICDEINYILPTICHLDDKVRWKIPEDKTEWQRQCRVRNEMNYIVDNAPKYDRNGFANNASGSYTIQKALEEFAVSYVESKLETIKDHDNNVIMSGGIALNVLVNELLKTKFPDINFYVPSNPHDGGLSFGSLYRLLREKSIIKRNDYNILYNGIEVIDQEQWKNKNYKEVKLSDVSQLLKEGNIIGFVNDRAEVGPRALGNRSILCDASYPGMKTKINLIKNREQYRPFAPACLKEHASKYFESNHFDNMEAMQYVVKVKEEYKEQLEPIVHVDGTARLQTVSLSDNPVFYELIKMHGGVLLNTSFNIGGKPTLNTLADAFEMLDKTTLDYVVWGKNGKFKLYQ